LLDSELDLAAFDARYCNDTSGAPAYEPRVLLKAILFGYSRGLVSIRAIERVCRENVVFIALTRDAVPHFTTLAGFLRAAGEQIPALFAQVLYLCDRQGLIGRDPAISFRDA
jgi:transposase